MDSKICKEMLVRQLEIMECTLETLKDINRETGRQLDLTNLETSIVEVFEDIESEELDYENIEVRR